MGAPIRNLTEDEIHKGIVAWLRAVLPADAIIHHPRNEGNRGGRAGLMDGVRGQAMGVMPGFPDLLIYVDGRGYCIEVKRPGAYQTQIQRLVQQKLDAQGIPYAVCRSVNDARDTLASWGVATRELSLIHI